MNDLTFSPLEKKALELLLAGEDPVLDVLRQQLSSATISSRQYTGVGYYLNFDLPHKRSGFQETINFRSRFCINDVGAVLKIGNYEQKVGLLFWVLDGYIDSLEAYTFGEENWPDNYDTFHVHYLFGERNLDDLRGEWKT